jgi:hypothetical protein
LPSPKELAILGQYLKSKDKGLRGLVIISDIHAGSTEALLHPGFLTEKAQPVGQTPIARWMWECWGFANTWLAGVFDPKEYALIVNGDCIEGNHHCTDEIWSVNPRDHAKCAVELLEPLAKRAAKTFMVKGTEIHVGDQENSIGHKIGAEVNPEHGQPFWQRLALDICGVRVSVRHHFPATTRSYLEGSQHSIQLGNATVEAVRAGDRAPQILIGAHRHRTGHFCDGNRLTVVTGAWQGITKHVWKIAPDARPCPSIYALDWRDKGDGELPAVHFRIFNPPTGGSVSV